MIGGTSSRHRAWAVAAVTGSGAAIGVVLSAVRRRAGTAHGSMSGSPGSDVEAVTINRPESVVLAGGVHKGPVADLGDRVDVVAVAAGGKGTELRARWREPGAAGGPGNGGGAGARQAQQELRLALRRTRQLVETGEILAVEPQPAGHRPRTPAGSMLDALVRRSAAGGVR